MKTATGLILWWMRICGFYGWTSSFGNIYARPGFESSQILRKHEECHVAQIQRDGFIGYHLKSIWYLLKYGYTNSPYEVEAREAETK